MTSKKLFEATEWGYGSQIFSHLAPGIQIGEILGEGNNGKVYPLSNGRVIKLIPRPSDDSDEFFKDEVQKEIDMQIKCSLLGLGPIVYRSFTYEDDDSNLYAVIEMDRELLLSHYIYQIDGNHKHIYKMIADQLSCLIDKLVEGGVIHGDLRISNIAIRLTSDGFPKELIPIDFGLSSVKENGHPVLELILFLTSTFNIFTDVSHLRMCVYSIYSHWMVLIDGNLDHIAACEETALENEYKKVMREYGKSIGLDLSWRSES
ncbi:serine/threonine-protein kinase [bacterium]|nr:serine/threonine-protein kinase [bacterium]